MKEEIVNKKILVIGDSIVDKVTYVSDAGTSLETPNLKVKHRDETIQLGGTARVVNFLSEFDVDIEFFTNLEEKYIDRFENKYLKLNLVDIGTLSTAEKNRFIVKKNNKYQTIFQVNKAFKSASNSSIENFNFNNNNYDIVLLNDYRTGLFDKQLISKVNQANFKKVILASQLSKNEKNIKNYKNFHTLILNKYEFEKEFNTNVNFDFKYIDIFNDKLEKIIITLGEKGALLITKNKNTYFPTDSKKFINTIGAGDIFLGSYLLFENINAANRHSLDFLEEINEKL